MTPELPPLNVYERWLRSGFGRAALVTHPDMPQEYKDEIVYYSLTDYRIDRQFGAPNGQFLCELAKRAGMEEAIIDLLIESDFKVGDLRDVDHLHRLRIIGAYLSKGNPRALAHLRGLVSAGDEIAAKAYIEALNDLATNQVEWAFDELTVFALAGRDDAIAAIRDIKPKGLIWIARHGLHLISAESYWWVDLLYESETNDLSSIPHDVLATLRSAVNQAEEESALNREKLAVPSYTASEEGLHVDLLKGRIPDRVVPALRSRFSEDDQKTIWETWLDEVDEDIARGLYKAVAPNQFPFSVNEIIQRVLAGKEPFLYSSVLERINHPECRALGLNLLMEIETFDTGMQVMASSVTPEDLDHLIPLATEAMNGELDGTAEHNVVFAVRRMSKHLSKDAAIKALRWIYETSTCSECRSHALTDLIKDLGADVTDWIEETQFDADYYVQELGKELRAKQTS